MGKSHRSEPQESYVVLYYNHEADVWKPVTDPTTNYSKCYDAWCKFTGHGTKFVGQEDKEDIYRMANALDPVPGPKHPRTKRIIRSGNA